jgi:transcriptional regulator with XRE-family HTH domain
MAAKTPNQVVSENVETLRRKRGLSQQEIGKAIGRSQSQADRKLKAASKWSLEEIGLVADFLGVTSAFLQEEHSEN